MTNTDTIDRINDSWSEHHSVRPQKWGYWYEQEDRIALLDIDNKNCHIVSDTVVKVQE